MDLDHVGDHLPAGQAVVDAVRSLALPVADVRAEVAGPVAAGLLNALSHFLHQYVQMAAAGVAVPVSALDHHLRF